MIMGKLYRTGFISSSGATGTTCLLTGLLFAGLAVTAPGGVARAESPMQVDDASTLDRGRLKIETLYRRDGGRRFTEAVFGVGAFPSVELEVSGGLGQDRDLSPRADLSGAGLGLKWVPIAQDLGWSLGARYDYGRLRIKPDAPGLRSTETDHALTGLATYRFTAGLAAHMNVGVQYGRVDGDSDTVGTWGLGVDWAVYGPLTVIAETYGLDGSSRRALGLRYTIREGLKASAAAGRGQGLSFGQVGVAWEF
jgi:hypothetical protein